MVLYLFTSSFPFGTGEGFLEDEIKVLSSSFENIAIIPMFIHSNNQPRPVPYNVKVLSPIMNRRTKHNIFGLFNARSFLPYCKDFFINKVYKNKQRLRAWTSEYLHINIILNSPIVRSIKKTIEKGDIVYSYWGRDAYALCLFWKNRCRFVSRFHGSTDLWEDNSDNYKPLRHQIIQHLDLSVSVSEKGRSYLDSKYPGGHVIVGRLGNNDYGVSKRSSDGILRVLSCSNIIALKRVERILQSVSLIKHKKIEWTHIGSGPLQKNLKEMIDHKTTTNLNVVLTGQLSHDEVIEYYLKHPVDVFVNLSSIEGIPVSIMEAISFDIPVVATDVGATSEIVNQQTGILLSDNPSCQEVAAAIEILGEKELHPRLFWRNNYNSKKNYCEFVSRLKSI